MTIEWDDQKNIENKQKHGINFETASGVFADPFRIERVDHSENNPGEDRIQTIGLCRKGTIRRIHRTKRSISLNLCKNCKQKRKEIILWLL